MNIGTAIATLITKMKYSNGLHSSLFSTGSWRTTGCYYDDKGKYAWAEGQTQIFHRAKHWYAQYSLRLSNSRTIESSYQIGASGTGTAKWTARSSLLKNCRAKFQVQEGLILSTFSSEDGRFCGYEVLRRHSASRYTNLGELFFDEHKHSSWSLELHKLTDEEVGK